MMNRRNRNRCRLHFVVSGDELIDRSEGAAAKFARKRVGAGNIGINNSCQANRLALLRKILIDARVVASECTGANDCNRYQAFFTQSRCLADDLNGY